MLRRMTDEKPRGADIAADLQDYLQRARTGMLSRLDGLGEYDIRRPMTPTGTNLLGLVKHLAGIELSYLGSCVGRPSEIRLPWVEDGSISTEPRGVTRTNPSENWDLRHPAMWSGGLRTGVTPLLARYSLGSRPRPPNMLGMPTFCESSLMGAPVTTTTTSETPTGGATTSAAFRRRPTHFGTPGAAPRPARCARRSVPMIRRSRRQSLSPAASRQPATASWSPWRRA